jgi:hypothetical protein
VAVHLDQPFTVVLVLELEQRQSQLLDRREAADPEQLLLQCLHEPLTHPVALGFAHEDWARFDSEKDDLALVVAAAELAAVVVAELETDRNLLVVVTEDEADSLPDRFRSLVPVALAGGVDAQALAGAMVDREEDVGLALGRQRAGLVGAPHLIGLVGGDPAVVDLGDRQLERARRRQ